MFESIEGSIRHIYAHGTSPEEVIVGSAEIQHPKTKARNWCDLDSEFVLGDFENCRTPTVVFYFVTRTITASKHASASFFLESGPGGPSIKEGV